MFPITFRFPQQQTSYCLLFQKWSKTIVSFWRLIYKVIHTHCFFFRYLTKLIKEFFKDYYWLNINRTFYDINQFYLFFMKYSKWFVFNQQLTSWFHDEQVFFSSYAPHCMPITNLSAACEESGIIAALLLRFVVLKFFFFKISFFSHRKVLLMCESIQSLYSLRENFLSL